MIRIVTDTNASLTPEEAEALGVKMAPIVIHMNGETLRDAFDITPEAYTEKLKQAKTLPTTSQPSVGVFEAIYRQLFEEGADEIISIHLSSKLSGTYQSAMTAAQAFPKGKVHVFDSYLASGVIALMVMEAVEMAEAGADAETILATLARRREKGHVVFLVDTLEYLHKGGRIGGASRFLGTLLKVKPILYLEDGLIEALEQQRTARKAFQRLKELGVETAAPYAQVDLAVFEIDAAEKAEELADYLRARLNVRRFYTCKVGPGLSTHTGPGALGFGIIGVA
jgi:DegV family protein with EDD domain